MKYVRKIPDRREMCDLCLIQRSADFLMEEKNGKQITVCCYHYGKARGYINE